MSDQTLQVEFHPDFRGDFLLLPLNRSEDAAAAAAGLREELICGQAQVAPLPLINPLPGRKRSWMQRVRPQLLCRTSSE